MRRSLIIALAGFALFIVGGKEGIAQNKRPISDQTAVYESSYYGFRFTYRGTLTEQSKDNYLIDLPTGADENFGSQVHIFVDQRPFVLLPGTYGGKFYFGDNRTSKILEDRVSGDSVNVNGLRFARDYWAVYAGHGQWETVINCYAFHGGQFYVVSLGHNVSTVMPGEIINGSRMTKQGIQNELIDALRDTTNDSVKSFEKILQSFSITK